MDETRDRILRAASRIFAAEGFRGATTRQIAADAGVNEVTLFRLFSTKEALLAAATETASESTIQRLRALSPPREPVDVRAELAPWLRAVLHGFAASAPAVRTSLAEWGRHPALDERLLATARYVHDELAAYIVRAQAAGLVRSDLDPAAATSAIIAPVFAHGMLHEMLPVSYPGPLDHALEQYLDITLDGLIARKASEHDQ